MMIELAKSAHCVGEAGLHMIFTPAYRREVFAAPGVKPLAERYIREKAEKMGVIVSAMDFGPDHVHIFLNGWKGYSIEEIARQLKGYSSYMMRKGHWSLFSSMLWGDKFWSGGYFYRTVGAITSESVMYYIQNSQEKHWDVVDYETYRERKHQLSIRQFTN